MSLMSINRMIEKVANALVFFFLSVSAFSHYFRQKKILSRVVCHFKLSNIVLIFSTILDIA